MGQKTTLLAVGLIVFAIILTILFIVSRVIGGGGNDNNSNEPKSTNEVQEVRNQNETITNIVPVSEIISTPTVYQGYNLSVNATITSWATNKSFYFASETRGLFGGTSRGALLVVSEEAFQLPQDPTDGKLGVGETANVTASGTIVILNREEIQSLLGINLDDPEWELGNQVLYRWQLGPVLLLDKYQIIESK